MSSITAHMLVQNEDQFIWYAIQSVLPFVDNILITDNGSTDRTLPLIKSIKSPKIELTELSPTDRNGLISRRQNQISRTKSEWILLIDGDEIWPDKNFKHLIKEMKDSQETIFGLVCRTRNSVGDIYHYQPESAGKYTLLGKTGHFTIRAIRNHPTLKLTGEYPNEAFTINDHKLQDLESNLKFVDTWYLHTTHLRRSSNRQAENKVVDRINKLKLETGIEMRETELPEIFFSNNIPSLVPRPQEFKLSGVTKLTAQGISLLKSIKRQL